MAAPHTMEGSPKGTRRSTVATLAVAAAALLASAFAFAMPPFQVNDEHGHFVRAYQISRGDWRGDPAPALPRTVLDFLLRYREASDDERKLAPSEVWRDVTARPAASTAESRFVGDAGHRYTNWSILASSLYCPVVYLPAAAGIAAARVAGLSPGAMLYAARLFNVAAFAFAIWLAFRLAPESRALFAAVALMPMTLHQAGGVSADLMTIAVSFVGFALIVRARAMPPEPRLLVIAAALFPLWVLCKTSVWALPLLCFIPRRHFNSRWRRVLFIGGVTLAAIAALVLWQHAIRGNLQLFRADRLARGMDTSGNVAFLLAHPLRFGGMLLAHMAAHFREHSGQFLGAFGWTKLMLPMPARIFYFGLLLFAAIFEPPGRRISVSERIAFASLFLATMGAAYIVLFASDGVLTPPGNPRSFGFPYSAGVQGRYFIPFCLAGFLALRQTRFTLPAPRVLAAVLYTATAFDLLFAALIWNHYYL